MPPACRSGLPATGFQRGEPFGEPSVLGGERLVLLPGLRRHLLHDLEFVACNDVEIGDGALEALARWAQLADPAFDPDLAMRRFTEGYRLPLDVTASVRGSRNGELVARCVVECGTSSFYSAIRDTTDEPVLKVVAGKIAADEFRHFKLFYDHLQRYQQAQPMSRFSRLRIALGRMQEASDDELAMAYWCGNGCEGVYDREKQSAAYELRASRVYRFGHIQRGLSMALKACDLDPQSRFSRGFAALVWRVMQWRQRRLATVTVKGGTRPTISLQLQHCLPGRSAYTEPA